VVADAAAALAHWQRITASDRDPARCQGELLPGIALLLPEFAGQEPGEIHVAIGDARSREREAAILGMARLASIVHPLACVSAHAHMGRGCFVAALSLLAAGASLGDGVIVNHGAMVDHDATVGDFSHIAPNVTMGGFASVGRRVLVGAGATILPHIAIGDDIVIGAGAVVCEPVLQAGTYAGVPARRLA
jgi:sugar O-acyltransferase (sialic acid O-acetyltransferase NeuD family)